MSAADARYGNYASVHEALGVLCEEFDELFQAAQANDLPAVQREALDIASAALRLADQLADLDSPMARRSVK